MIVFPNAKVNLGLNVVRKRKDGFHEIESCFYPIGLYDSLEIVEKNNQSFHAYGFEIPKNNQSNICVKAYELLKNEVNLPPIAIHLLKNIPIGGGLGGGSSDGVFMLQLLNKKFDLRLDTTALKKYSLKLGSDCPFFIENKPALVYGRGEVIEPIELDLKDYKIAIHHPNIHISTKDAFRDIIPSHRKKNLAKVINTSLENWKYDLKNDFEDAIYKIYPQIEFIKDEMYETGALYSSMTGSGSAVYGIFRHDVKVPWNTYRFI